MKEGESINEEKNGRNWNRKLNEGKRIERGKRFNN